MLVLGLETSCDETAAALVEDGQVLANVVRSQIEQHAPFGGVVPDLAARMHTEAVQLVVQQAFEAAGRSPAEVDAVAATRAPGLVNCLVVGLSWAKAFAVGRELPFVAIDHVEAHIHACRMPEPGPGQEPPELELPFVALVASGGHTAIYRYGGPGQIALLGRTSDDAAGEAFDKVAVLLGLDYPGGPAVEQAARTGDQGAFDFPRGKVKTSPYGFSFSGLKTAVLYATRGRNQPRDAPLLPGIEIPDVAASFQEAVCDVLSKRLVQAALDEGVGAIAIGGGVAHNGRLRQLCAERAESAGLEFFPSPRAYCSDNAAMVAGLAWAQLEAGLAPRPADLELPAQARSEAA